MTGIKYDDGKSALELIPPKAEVEIGNVMGYGADKYGEYNYLQGMEWTRMVGAAKRHINSWLDGEDNDPESGLHHLAHAAISCMMALEYQFRKVGTDDRFKTPVPVETAPVGSTVTVPQAVPSTPTITLSSALETAIKTGVVPDMSTPITGGGSVS